MKNLCFIVLIFILFFSIISCERIEPQIAGELQMVKLAKVDGIPAEYGTLVGITTHARIANWAQLWFVDNDSTIRLVNVGSSSGRINEKVLVIPRN